MLYRSEMGPKRVGMIPVWGENDIENKFHKIENNY
jgi:hypothetical protein